MVPKSLLAVMQTKPQFQASDGKWVVITLPTLEALEQHLTGEAGALNFYSTEMYVFEDGVEALYKSIDFVVSEFGADQGIISTVIGKCAKLVPKIFQCSYHICSLHSWYLLKFTGRAELLQHRNVCVRRRRIQAL